MAVYLSDTDAGIDKRHGLWDSLRRVHFYISDLATETLESRGIAIPERRVLDGLAYVARFSAAGGVTVTDLCDLMPSGVKTQTATSTLARLEKKGWVASSAVAGRRDRVRDKHLWHLTGDGHDKRSLYIDAVEQILKEVYAEAFLDGPQRERLKHLQSQAEERFSTAMNFIDERYLPVLELAGGAVEELPELERDMWAALRRTHFYISDLIYREIEPVGIGPAERRVLDALGFAYSRGAVDGIPIAVICDLNRAANRQSVTMALERMSDTDSGAGPGWVEQSKSVRAGRRRGRLWRMTGKGLRVRRTYMRYARHKIQEAYELDDASQRSDDALLKIAESAESYRNRLLEPIVESFLEN